MGGYSGRQAWRILREDRDLMVVYKEAGLAVESARVTEPDLMGYLRAAAGEIYMVHRLDQPVEGILVFAKTKAAAAALSKQFRDKTAEKRYTAVVTGKIPGESGVLTDWLVKDAATNRSLVVPEPGSGAGKAGGKHAPKKAVLEYRRTGERELGIRLLTGRHHQIRVQLAHAGMPILGDRKYGGEADTRGILREGAIALGASFLSFVHPRGGKRMEFREGPSFAAACGGTWTPDTAGSGAGRMANLP